MTRPPLARKRDRRGVPYVEVTVRVTGPASIAALEDLAALGGRSPSAVASALVGEELWYLTARGMRDHVRRARAERRAAYDPGGNRR
jgi:hypothetical protein